MSFSKADFADLTQIGDEALEAYAHWGAQLEKWNAHINLVAPSTVGDFWHRHAYDSWQIVNHIAAPVKTVIDLGSGAGFPGIAVAIDMKRRGAGHVTLVESAGKKANFLRSIIRELSLPAQVINERAEAMERQTYDRVTARAFAPLPNLLSYAHPFWGDKTRGLFLKGRGLAKEITSAQSEWEFSHKTHQSVTDEMANIVEISELTRRVEQTPIAKHSKARG